MTKAIEEKMVRLGNLQVQLVELKEDLDDTSKGIVEDKKFLADLQTDCKTKGAEHEENQKLRSQELLALADTIKVPSVHASSFRKVALAFLECSVCPRNLFGFTRPRKKHKVNISHETLFARELRRVQKLQTSTLGVSCIFSAI